MYVSMYLSSMYLCIYVSMYLCIYVSMYLCIYVSMYLSMYLCMYLSIYLCMYVCIDVSMYRCIDVSMYRCIDVYIGRNDAQQHQVDKDHNAHEGLKALTHHHFGKEDTALGPYHLSPKMSGQVQDVQDSSLSVCWYCVLNVFTCMAVFRTSRLL